MSKYIAAHNNLGLLTPRRTRGSKKNGDEQKEKDLKRKASASLQRGKDKRSTKHSPGRSKKDSRYLPSAKVIEGDKGGEFELSPTSHHTKNNKKSF